MLYPEQQFSDLFVAVQSGRVFSDSKTFVDATPRLAAKKIMEEYHRQCSGADFCLKQFVENYFDLPNQKADVAPARAEGIWPHIENLWGLLAREADQPDDSSLLPLANAYTVPGGRFREIYYWDSYFTMLGLAVSGRDEMVACMVENFACMLRQHGLIPNGNRSYYLSRSQPPYFSLMVELLVELKQDSSIYLQYIDALEIEYNFWMDGADTLTHSGQAFRRVVKLNGNLLNRYWDDADRPRPESYYEDTQLANNFTGSESQFYRDIRSACESGWDFSSRWFGRADDFSTIETTEVVPIDLNCLMMKLESTLAKAYGLNQDEAQAAVFLNLAQRRQHCIQTLFYDSRRQWFCDLSLSTAEPRPQLSLAGVYPLFFQLASPGQAESVAKLLEQNFLRPGGWLTSLLSTEHQWDAPNGWAPLQWTVYQGLKNYGFDTLAKQGAKCWIENNIQLFEQSGQLLEKYDVESPGRVAGGGEYQVQHGFGWTNGVLLKLAGELGYQK